MSTTEYDLRFAALEQRVTALEKERSGRKAKPILVSAVGVCGVDPSIDSTTCPHVSLYRRQQGCMGTACMNYASEYYQDYRLSNPPRKRTRVKTKTKK